MLKHLLLSSAAALALGPAAAAQDGGIDFSEYVDTWRIGILGGENEQDRLKDYDCFADHITETFNVEVELFPASDYAGVLQGLLAGNLEMGLGPLAGVLAIATSDTGTLSKVYSEAVEGLDKGQMEGVKATGAAPPRLYRFGALPQLAPVFISLSLYFFESSTRSATILGIVGAGGIGFQLSERMRANLWDQAAFIILVILATVTLIDTLSRVIRERCIGKRSL